MFTQVMIAEVVEALCAGGRHACGASWAVVTISGSMPTSFYSIQHHDITNLGLVGEQKAIMYLADPENYLYPSLQLLQIHFTLPNAPHPPSNAVTPVKSMIPPY